MSRVETGEYACHLCNIPCIYHTRSNMSTNNMPRSGLRTRFKGNEILTGGEEIGLTCSGPSWEGIGRHDKSSGRPIAQGRHNRESTIISTRANRVAISPYQTEKRATTESRPCRARRLAEPMETKRSLGSENKKENLAARNKLHSKHKWLSQLPRTDPQQFSCSYCCNKNCRAH